MLRQSQMVSPITRLASTREIQDEIYILLPVQEDSHPLALHLRLSSFLPILVQLLNLFTTATSPSLEADDQKYQTKSANEELPTATCCIGPTTTALPAKFVVGNFE